MAKNAVAISEQSAADLFPELTRLSKSEASW
jgi:hypothetical protein